MRGDKVGRVDPVVVGQPEGLRDALGDGVPVRETSLTEEEGERVLGMEGEGRLENDREGEAEEEWERRGEAE